MAEEVVRDEGLVQRYLNGEQDAFGRLVERYSERLFNLAYRFSADQAEAEDIVQESFLHAYLALPRSRTELPFKPWLFQIVLNTCRDHARKKRPLSFSELPSEEESGSPYLESIQDQAILPSEQAELDELEGELHQAILALPEEERMILTLRYNEGLSYEEIGQILKIPPTTVGTHLYRAKRRLQAALSVYEKAGP